jgi:hypothetical protein
MANVIQLPRGRKHRCLGCAAPFYDMEKTPIVCPKCGVTFEPTIGMPTEGRRPRKARAWGAAAAKPQPAAEAEPAEADDGAVPLLDDADPAEDPAEELEIVDEEETAKTPDEEPEPK